MTAPAKRGPGHPPLAEDDASVRLHLLVTASAKAELEEHARRLGVSAGAVVREAVERYLARERKRRQR